MNFKTPVFGVSIYSDERFSLDVIGKKIDLSLESMLTLSATSSNRFKCSVLLLTCFSKCIAYHAGMFSTPSGRKTFVVKCKECRRDVPSGREEFDWGVSPSVRGREFFHLTTAALGRIVTTEGCGHLLSTLK